MKISTYKSLRSKMLLAISAGLLLLFILLFITARTIILNGYAKLENDKALIQVNSAKSLLEEQSIQLSNVTSDYAHWDLTYEYVINHNEEFITKNIDDSVFYNIKINALFIVDNQGQVIFKRGIDYTTLKPLAIPEKLQKEASFDGVLLNTKKEQISGFFWTNQGIYIVSAAAIYNSQRGGERRGTLIMARLLDNKEIQRVNQILSTHLSLEAIKNGNNTDLVGSLLKKSPQFKVLNDKRVASYALLYDIGSNTNRVISTVSDREIYAQGKSSLNFLYWFLGLIGGLLALFSWLVDKLILSRLANLSHHVKNIADTANTGKRIEALGGNDEIASLANNINGMLAKLDESQLELSIEKERAIVTLSGIADAIITTNPNGEVTYMNAAAERLTGASNNEANLKPLALLFHLMSEDELTLIDCAWLTDSTSALDEVKFERTDGEIFLLTKSTSTIYDEKMLKYGTVTVIHDVTMLRKLTTQVSYQAKHDQLTGLVNRYEFERKLQEAIDETTSDERLYCLAYFDLDRFKIVNDTCGHNAGDLLLQQLSNLIKSKVRSADILARIGGDEFALLLNGCDVDKAYQVIESLRDAVQDYQFNYEGKLFKIGASFGLTKISVHQTLTISELFATVDSACYAAKSKGGNCIQVHSHGDDRLSQRLNHQNWVADIQSALEKNLFVLFYQQIQGLRNNTQGHLELLVRLRGNDGKLHLPSSFLPAAERYHLMPQIDRWVIHEAFRIIAGKGADFTSVCAINLSGQSLSDDTLLNYIVKQIKHHGVDPKRICFEITETAVIANIDQARLLMNDLRDLGCSFSLDDFGSGLSSFAYLKNLQVDYLKIDGMFVKNIVKNKIDRAMVESINNIGHVMDLQTIGEFAENQAIIEVLKEIGVDYAQGYGVAMPILFE